MWNYQQFNKICIYSSKSCPTCRKKTTTKNVLKLYFDSAITGDTQIDPDSLQNQIDSLKVGRNFLYI